MPNRRKIAAFALPMLTFIALLVVNVLLKKVGPGFWLASAEYWVYPLQTVVCGALLLWYRREYAWDRPARPGFAVLVALVVFAVWILPQTLLGFAPRTEGFNPDVFAGQPGLYWATMAFRFLRLVVVVPLLEEIFWRGFLLRYLIAEDFERVPFGKFSWFSFTAVTLLFALSHAKPDWAAAVLAGALYNWVAYRSKSLSACVLAHAVTNLVLGVWIVQTRQWGFW